MQSSNNFTKYQITNNMPSCKLQKAKATTNKPYPMRWSLLHGSINSIGLYQKQWHS